MVDWIAIVILFGAIVFGIGFGYFFAKFLVWRDEKKQQKNLKQVMDGKRKNQIEIEGEVHEAYKFRVKDKEGKEMLIDLKGGTIKEDAKEKNKRLEKPANRRIERNKKDLRRTDRNPPRKKRNIRERRIRRFG